MLVYPPAPNTPVGTDVPGVPAMALLAVDKLGAVAKIVPLYASTLVVFGGLFPPQTKPFVDVPPENPCCLPSFNVPDIAVQLVQSKDSPLVAKGFPPTEIAAV